jgi:hypothetical protein
VAVGQLSQLSGAWLTTAQQNAVVGYPAAETYPGPVSEPHDPVSTGEPLVRNEALTGQLEGPAFTAEPVPEVPQGGVIGDTVAQFGNSAPTASFDAQTEPFAPAGPVGATHGYDTGGTWRTEHFTEPSSPGWYRRTATMQTFNRQSFVTDTAGWGQTVPNDRQDLIQDQGQALDAGTRWLPYSERPITARFAAEAYPILDQPGGPYNPAGELTNLYAMGGQGNLVYEAPPDPLANVHNPVSAPAPASDPVMEFVR